MMSNLEHMDTQTAGDGMPLSEECRSKGATIDMVAESRFKELEAELCRGGVWRTLSRDVTSIPQATISY